MQGPSFPEVSHAPPQSPKKLDTVVKLGLGVLVGSFILIGVGMFLSRPDRPIPPYSIASQAAPIVVAHVPAWTSDRGVPRLVRRSREVGRVGPLAGKDTAATAAHARVLFKGVITSAAPDQPE